MTLNTLWFILIAVLYIGFFVLEGFDFGVGMLLPFLSKDDTRRRVILNTVGPHWDGNEVWLLTAGGATFAAFPHWYATMFSGFYIALFLLLLALIVRGVGFEFRSQLPNPRWRQGWDMALAVSSFLAALLLGVAFANLARGVAIDADMQYVGGFFNLLNPYALVGGVVAVLGFALHGAIFLSLKTTGDLQAQARAWAFKLWVPAVIALLAFAGYTYFETDLLTKVGVNPGIVPLLAPAALLATGYFLRIKREGWAFVTTFVTIAATLVTCFLIMYPRVMISTLNPAWSLTIENAASSPYTLTVMTIVALIFVPIVLIYQGWTYWVFRHRLENKVEGLTY